MNSSKALITLSLLWASVLLLLGSWWIYLMLNMDKMLLRMDRISFSKMLYWEGTSFVTLLILLSATLLIFFLKDQKKSKSLQDFFASLTHELKTPLASIKLQGEVIGELTNDQNSPQLKKLLSRLTEDTIKLEAQMDRILQLSKMEHGGKLILSNVKIIPLINEIAKDWCKNINLDIDCKNPNTTILADEFALSLIIKNLFENSKIHSKSKTIKIKISENNKLVILNYDDFGIFEGNQKKISTLFYKYNSSKGSGIGLYLIKKLSLKMNARFDIKFTPNLNFTLTFNNAEDSHA